MNIATMFAAAFLGFSVLQLVLLVADWRAGMLRRVAELEESLRETRAERDRWCKAAQPHEAARAEWRDTKDENRELRAAKATLRRRLRGVLWQARAWKAEAVSRGWTREESNSANSALKVLRGAAKERRRAAKAQSAPRSGR